MHFSLLYFSSFFLYWTKKEKIYKRSRYRRPAYGGKYCTGPSDDCKICESVKCTTNIDLRAQQCSRLIDILDFKEISSKLNTTWLAYEPEEHELKCRLVCRSKETGEIFYSGKNLMNGTPCSYGSTDICIQVTKGNLYYLSEIEEGQTL